MKKEQIWIEKGYKTFAYEGPNGLKIERLSKSVGKNKSSFYHYFSDIEIFVQELLAFHLNQVEEIAYKESLATNENELIVILLYHKIDFLFNRQLRIHREVDEFKDCFSKSTEISKPSFLPLWKKIIDLNENSYLAEMVFILSIENFFLQITDETLTNEWLKEYFKSIKNMVQQFKKTDLTRKLNDSV